MTPVIEKIEGSEHFDVYYPIEHEDLLSRDGIILAIGDLREAWQHFLKLRKKHSKKRLPYYFWYHFHDGKNFHKADRNHVNLYHNLNQFWMNAATQKDLVPLYKSYLEDLLAHLQDKSIKGNDKSLWHSEEFQIGEVMTFQLAMADQSYISLYANLFQYWDMDHEVNQLKEVQSIIEKYGVTEGTLDLIRKRCSARGQHDLEQFLHFLKFAKSNLGNLKTNSKLVELIRDFGTLGWDDYELKFEDPFWNWTDESHKNIPTLDSTLRAEILNILNYNSIFVRGSRLMTTRWKGIRS